MFSEYEACYARCNCWSDFPDMGGEKIGEVDALCLFDKCYCDYNLVDEYGFIFNNILM